MFFFAKYSPLQHMRLLPEGKIKRTVAIKFVFIRGQHPKPNVVILRQRCHFGLLAIPLTDCLVSFWFMCVGVLVCFQKDVEDGGLHAERSGVGR